MTSQVKEKSLFTTVGMMMMIALTGKVMGLLRDRMFGSYFGTDTMEAIAFTNASALSRNFLDVAFAAVFSAAFIPVFSKHLEAKGREAAFDLGARFVAIIGLLAMAFTVICVILAAPIYTLLYQGENTTPENLELGISLLRVIFPMLILSGLAFSFAGILQSMGQFNIPSAMSVASNGVILLYYFFFIDRFGIYGLAIAFLLGGFLQIAIQVPFLTKKGFWRLPRGWCNDDGLRQIARLTLPVMVATWIIPIGLQINMRAVVDLYDGEHGVVAITFANTLFTIITGLLVLNLGNVLLPKLSKLTVSDNKAEYATFLRQNLRTLMFMLLPMTAGLMAIAHPLVRLAFQAGQFQYESVEITATALFFLSLGVLGFGLHVILCRACYAVQSGYAPMVTGIIAIAINFVLSFTLAPILEIAGPALASSIAITTAAVLLFIMLRRRLRTQQLWTREMTADVLKMLILSGVVFFAAYYTLQITEGFFTENTWTMRLATVIIPAGVGVALYMGGGFLLKISEARWLAGFILEKLRRR